MLEKVNHLKSAVEKICDNFSLYEDFMKKELK